MNHEVFKPRGGMGACPHVSEAKLTPPEGAGTAKALFAGALLASHRPTSRLEKQAVRRGQA